MAKFDAKRINSQYNIKKSLIRQKKQKKKKQPKLMRFIYIFLFFGQFDCHMY